MNIHKTYFYLCQLLLYLNNWFINIILYLLYYNISWIELFWKSISLWSRPLFFGNENLR